MAVEVEIIQPEGFQAEPALLESSDSLQTGNPLAGYIVAIVGLLAVAAFLLSLGNGEDQSSATEDQATTTPAPNNEALIGDADSDPTNQPDGGHSAEYQARRTTITEWSGGESLMVIENSQFIYELDLSTGRRTSWSPPELLVDADPLVLGEEIVVIGESGAWIGQPFTAEWRFLAEATRVMPSSREGRFWLQADLAITDSSASDYQWTEMDSSGNVFRTVLRDEPVTLSTPELSVGSDGVVMRLTAGESRPWRPLTANGTVVASGLNDLIIAECTPDGACGRVWYGPKSSTPKAGFYPDLAENVDVPFGSFLSPDGRFVVSGGEDRSEVVIASVANGRRLVNRCLGAHPISWTADSALLVCATATGAELIETDSGNSLGMAITGSEKWKRMAFIETEMLSPSR